MPVIWSSEEARKEHEFENRWHAAINRYSSERGAAEFPSLSFLYEAKTARREVKRLSRLFAMERKGELPKLHRQCSMSPVEPVTDNHLTCCLGTECRKCPHLAALDAAEMSDEERDEAKAWSCATHILMSGGDQAREGYLLTVDDKMYWEQVYASLGQDGE